MVRGTTLFKCTECGNQFKAPDIEWMGTTMSVPQPCPKCHSIRTRPSRLASVLSSDSMYEKIWQEMEENSEG